MKRKIVISFYHYLSIKMLKKDYSLIKNKRIDTKEDNLKH